MTVDDRIVTITDLGAPTTIGPCDIHAKLPDHCRNLSLAGSTGTVLRVARDESWVDVGWWNPDGSYGWTKRQRKPELLALVVHVDVT